MSDFAMGLLRAEKRAKDAVTVDKGDMKDADGDSILGKVKSRRKKPEPAAFKM
ncbi:MAG: hypothetical protein AAF556_10300 [Pseudomonadota bacterium]